MDPVTIGLIIAGVKAAADIGSSGIGASRAKKLGERKAKEMERGTLADLFNRSLDTGADLQSMGMKSSAQLGRRRNQALRDTAASVRESFKI